MPRPILVALDGSDNSLRALKLAAGWSKSTGAPLHLLFVQPPISSSRALSQQLIDEHHERQTEQAFKKARTFVQRAGISAKFVTETGDPAATIAAYADKCRGQQIVIGNRGHGAVAGIFLGSVALKVVQLANVPVTMVK